MTQIFPQGWSACCLRLLHSPNLVAIGLSVGYETWPPIGWHHPFVIGWSKYSLGLPNAPLHYGLSWPVGILTVFQTPVTVPLHSPNGRQATCLPLGLCKGTVKESTAAHNRLESWARWCWKASGSVRISMEIFSLPIICSMFFLGNLELYFLFAFCHFLPLGWSRS